MSDCYVVVETQKADGYPFETGAGHSTRDEVIAEFGMDPTKPDGRQLYQTEPYQRWVAVIDCPNRLAHG